MKMLTPTDRQQIKDLLLEPLSAFPVKNSGVGALVEASLSRAVDHGRKIAYLLNHSPLDHPPGTKGTGVQSLLHIFDCIATKRSCMGLMNRAGVTLVQTVCGRSPGSWVMDLEKLTANHLHHVESLTSATGDDKAVERIIREIKVEGYVRALTVYQNEVDFDIPGLVEWHAAHAFSPALWAGSKSLRAAFEACFDAGTTDETIRTDFDIHFAAVVFRSALGTVYDTYRDTAPRLDTIDERLDITRRAIFELMHADEIA